MRARISERRRYFSGGLHALHTHGQEYYLTQRPAAAQHADDVVYRRARARGYNRDALRVAGYRLLVLARKQALFLKPGLKLLVGYLEVAEALGDYRLAVELVRAVARIDADAAVSRDAHAALGPKTQLTRRGAEHYAFERALRVLEREIVVPGWVYLVV